MAGSGFSKGLSWPSAEHDWILTGNFPEMINLHQSEPAEDGDYFSAPAPTEPDARPRAEVEKERAGGRAAAGTTLAWKNGD
jgi:hypothetical protein